MAGAKYASETGLFERAIYNSINMAAEPEETETVKDSDISSSKKPLIC